MKAEENQVETLVLVHEGLIPGEIVVYAWCAVAGLGSEEVAQQQTARGCRGRNGDRRDADVCPAVSSAWVGAKSRDLSERSSNFLRRQ